FWTLAKDVHMKSTWNSVVAEGSGTVKKWVFQSDKPVFISTAFRRADMLVCPGDSVQVTITPDGIITYAGKGAESLQLQYDLEQVQSKLQKPTLYTFKIVSLKDYLRHNNYLNKRLESVTDILHLGSTNVPDSIFQIIKAKTIYDIEFSRAEAFTALINH